MAYNNLEEFIQVLERQGELKRITFPVKTELEITEIADRVGYSIYIYKFPQSKVNP